MKAEHSVQLLVDSPNNRAPNNVIFYAYLRIAKLAPLTLGFGVHAPLNFSMHSIMHSKNQSILKLIVSLLIV